MRAMQAQHHSNVGHQLRASREYITLAQTHTRIRKNRTRDALHHATIMYVSFAGARLGPSVAIPTCVRTNAEAPRDGRENDRLAPNDWLRLNR